MNIQTFFTKFLIFCIFGLVLSGCAISSVSSTIIPTNTTTQNPNITNDNEFIPTEQPVSETVLPTQEITSTDNDEQSNQLLISPVYAIIVNFDYALQTAEVQQKITYANNSSTNLDNLMLSVDPLRQSGCFMLVNLKINGTEQTNYEVGSYWIQIPLSTPLAPYTSISIDLNYTINLPSLSNPLPDQKPGIFGFTILQSNFVDWYPFIPPISEKGEWILHEPWYFGEYLVYDLANFNVTINLINAPENTIIAASSQNLSKENNSFVFDHKQARNFVWSASPSYIISSEEVDGITINSYYFVFNQSAGEQALYETKQAVQFYQELFGPYPHKFLSIVEADFLDGMEYDGLYFLSKGFYNLFDGTPQGYLTMIAVHETAHQWWYTKIANDQAYEPWLDEALCTYTELLYYEKYYPEYVDWWWDYRVNYYQPSGSIDIPIYDYPSFISYRDATYLQGAIFFQQLRTLIGNDSFFKFLEDYAKTNSGKISSAKVFWEILSKYDSNVQEKLINDYFSESSK